VTWISHGHGRCVHRDRPLDELHRLPQTTTLMLSHEYGVDEYLGRTHLFIPLTDDRMPSVNPACKSALERTEGWQNGPTS
jgi:hypothetical protein